MSPNRDIDFGRMIEEGRRTIVDISSWKHWYGHNPMVIWRKMPATTCGRMNVSLRYQFLMDSLAPRKSRMGNHQLPPQIRYQKDFEMLIQGSSSSDGGKTEACWCRLGTASVHASVFKPGFVTFVGKRELGIWWKRQNLTCSLRGPLLFLGSQRADWMGSFCINFGCDNLHPLRQLTCGGFPWI
jgi:hypothetical protein